MKTYKEMADDALDRIKAYKTEKQNRRKRITRIAAPVAGCCLAVVVCVGAWQSGMLKNSAGLDDIDIDTGKEPYSSDETVSADGQNQMQSEQEASAGIRQNELKTDEYVIVAGNEDIKGSETPVMDACLFWWKNRILMYGELYFALNEDPDGTFAVDAVCRPTPENVSGFTYEGKTLFQLAVEADNERMLPYKMTELLKVGDELKYGSTLYESGAPSGIRWAKELYEEKIAYFGNELLDKYIIDGEFFSDELKRDIEEYNETSAARTYKLAYNAYLSDVLADAEEALSKNGIRCERTPYAQNGLRIVVTAEELENLPLENIEFWVFRLTNSDLKGSLRVDEASDLSVAN